MKKVRNDEEVEETEAEVEERSRFLEIARKVLLASFGAVALAQDEMEEFVNKLVDRGEIAEKDARKMLRELTEKRRHRAQHEIDKHMEELLEQFNVPSKADIDALGHKITALTHKVEDLKKTPV